MELHRSAAAAGVRLLAREIVGSTNTEALEQARAGERGPFWITAREQTAGRGRRGRAWRSPPGNLYASLLLTRPCSAARAPELSFVAGLALHDALAELGPGLGRRLELKWPNDVLLDGGKLAGILVEGETLGDGRFAVVLGFGVNCVAHPAGLPYRACDLAEAGLEVKPEQVFARLSGSIVARLAEWGSGENFPRIREAWLARALGLGQPILVRGPDSEVQGRFMGLDGDGRLILGLAGGGTRLVGSADVFPAAAPLGASGGEAA